MKKLNGLQLNTASFKNQCSIKAPALDIIKPTSKEIKPSPAGHLRRFLFVKSNNFPEANCRVCGSERALGGGGGAPQSGVQKTSFASSATKNSRDSHTPSARRRRADEIIHRRANWHIKVGPEESGGVISSLDNNHADKRQIFKNDSDVYSSPARGGRSGF